MPSGAPLPDARKRETALTTLRSLFVTGLLTLLPLWLTWVVFKFVFGLLSDSSRPWIGPLLINLAHRYPGVSWLADSWALTAVGVVATVLLILAVGLLARRVAGQRLLGWFEAAIRRVPLAKTVYGSSRQLLDLMSSPSGSGQRVVLVSFPHAGTKAVGFVTRTLRDDATSRQLGLGVRSHDAQSNRRLPAGGSARRAHSHRLDRRPGDDLHHFRRRGRTAAHAFHGGDRGTRNWEQRDARLTETAGNDDCPLRFAWRGGVRHLHPAPFFPLPVPRDFRPA